MHPEQIKAEIRMKGTTPAAIAADLTISRSTVSQVIVGRVVSARVRMHIAKVIGKSVQEIWVPKKTLRRVKPVAMLGVSNG
jgi:lambda repressor-like predicted transcriptional regulator